MSTGNLACTFPFFNKEHCPGPRHHLIRQHFPCNSWPHTVQCHELRRHTPRAPWHLHRWNWLVPHDSCIAGVDWCTMTSALLKLIDAPWPPHRWNWLKYAPENARHGPAQCHSQWFVHLQYHVLSSLVAVHRHCAHARGKSIWISTPYRIGPGQISLE